MMDRIRRKILKTGVAATVMAAAPRVLAQQAQQGEAAMSFYEKGPVRIAMRRPAPASRCCSSPAAD